MEPASKGITEEEHSPSTDRRLILGSILLSLTLSVVILGFRNLFDDELFSFSFVTGPVSYILEVAREGDVHPPGMYLLAHLAWRIVPSYRWLSLFPLAVLYAGLTLFLLNFVPRFRNWQAIWAALLFATLHPELMIWSNTLRWYCPWTGLALIALVLFLQPRRLAWGLSWPEAFGGGVLLATMFYLNYITALFLCALAVGLWLRLRGAKERFSFRPLLLALAIFLLLVAPQVRTVLTVHLENSRAQRSGVLISVVRLIQALTGSEAYVPWHPLAIAGGLACAFFLSTGLAILIRKRSADPGENGGALGEWPQHALAAFGLVFLLLVVLTGLGGKPRNAILLVPVFAPAVGFGVSRLRAVYRTVAVGVLVAWAAGGAVHLIGRFGLQKSNMNDRPEQVIALIRSEQGQAGKGCGVAVTYDGGAAFALAQARIPELLILSPYRGVFFAGTLDGVPDWCERPRLYVIHSYRSGEPDRDWKYTTELAAAKTFLGARRSVARLSPDYDAARKRRLSRMLGLESGASLPDYRFVVLSGEMERARFGELRRTLHYFVSGEEVVPDWPGDVQPGGR